MPHDDKPLGGLVSRHRIAPRILQRAAIVAAVSLIFFLAMLVAFYSRGNFGYFALAAAFLTVYIFALVGLLVRRRKVVSIFENGIRYGNFSAAWTDIVSVNADKDGLSLTRTDRGKCHIPSSMAGFEAILHSVQRGVETQDS
ncbi:MAG: hypothetical protein AB7Q37_01175 [Pyrinomonadaceae bacterium]